MGFPRVKNETCNLYMDITDGHPGPRAGEFVLTLAKDTPKGHFSKEHIRSAYLVSAVTRQNRRNKELPPRFNLHCYRSTAEEFELWWEDLERDRDLGFFLMAWNSRDKKK